MNLIQLAAHLDELLQFRSMGDGRVTNPFYDQEAAQLTLPPHRLGQGDVQSIPLSKLVSPQAGITYSKVRSMAGKIRRGTMDDDKLPTVTKVGDRYVLRDGNHRACGNRLVGKRKIAAKVQ